MMHGRREGHPLMVVGSAVDALDLALSHPRDGWLGGYTLHPPHLFRRTVCAGIGSGFPSHLHCSPPLKDTNLPLWSGGGVVVLVITNDVPEDGW